MRGGGTVHHHRHPPPPTPPPPPQSLWRSIRLRRVMLCCDVRTRCGSTRRRRRSGRPEIDTATKDDDAAAAPAVCYRGGARPANGWRAPKSAAFRPHTHSRPSRCNVLLYTTPVIHYGVCVRARCLWQRRRQRAGVHARANRHVGTAFLGSASHRSALIDPILFVIVGPSAPENRAYWPRFSPDHS